MGNCCTQANAGKAAEPGPKMPRHRLDKKWELYEAPREDINTKYWEQRGGKKIEALLEHTDLIDLRYIIENAEAGRPVPRWQDVPRGARINKENMHRIQAVGSLSGLAVLVLSYPWLDPGHPDKQLRTIRRLLPALKAYLRGLKEQTKRFGEHSTVGLLMDYPCLPQKNTNGTDDRTDEEKVRFKKGLIAINQWYLHECTTVIVFDTEMPGHDSGHTNVRPHSQRGWCKFELLAASIVKDNTSLWSLRGFEEGGSPLEYKDAISHATRMITRPAPMDPDRFGEVLRGGVAAGELAFTANADLEVVADQYAKAFEAAYTETTSLYYGGLNWGDEELKVLASALKRAKELGGLTQCKRVVVDRNLCTEAGLIPLIHALRGTSCQLVAQNTKCRSDDGKEAVRAAAWDAGVKLRLDDTDRD